jgi:hypothetical protein
MEPTRGEPTTGNNSKLSLLIVSYGLSTDGKKHSSLLQNVIIYNCKKIQKLKFC